MNFQIFSRSAARVLTIAALLAAPAVSAEELSLEERVKALEQRSGEDRARIGDLYLKNLEHTGGVRSFLGSHLALGGFFEGAVTALNGPDTESQVSANSNILGLNFAVDYERGIRFVTQFLTGLQFQLENPHNNPAVTPDHRQFRTPIFGAIVAQAYAEYTIADELRVQTGIGYVPYGHAFQQREPVLYRRRGGPLMASTASTSSVGIASPLWMGVHLLGTFAKSEKRTGYNLYTFTPGTYPKSLGVGGRLWWEPAEGITTGVSGQTGRQSTADNFTSLGWDFNWESAGGGVTIEIAGNKSANGSGSPYSYYAEPYLRLADGHWVVYAAGDYIDYPNNTTGSASTPDGYEKAVLGAGVNWLPVSFTRLRVGYLSHDYLGTTASLGGQIRRYHSLDFSCGVAF